MTMMCNVIQFQPKAAGPVLRRPRLLARAAKAGVASYRRNRDLPRILRCEELPAPDSAVLRLHAAEAELDDARREMRAEYDIQRHILVLIALLTEHRLARPAPLTCPGIASPTHP